MIQLFHVVDASVTVINNGAIQNYVHQDNHTHSNYERTTELNLSQRESHRGQVSLLKAIPIHH